MTSFYFHLLSNQVHSQSPIRCVLVGHSPLQCTITIFFVVVQMMNLIWMFHTYSTHRIMYNRNVSIVFYSLLDCATISIHAHNYLSRSQFKFMAYRYFVLLSVPKREVMCTDLAQRTTGFTIKATANIVPFQNSKFSLSLCRFF